MRRHVRADSARLWCNSILNRLAINFWHLRVRQAFGDLLSCLTSWRNVVLNTRMDWFGWDWYWRLVLVLAFACSRRILCLKLRFHMNCRLMNVPWLPIYTLPSTLRIVLRYHIESKPRCWFHFRILVALPTLCGTFLVPNSLPVSLRSLEDWLIRLVVRCFDFLRDSCTNTNVGPCKWTSTACTLSMWIFSVCKERNLVKMMTDGWLILVKLTWRISNNLSTLVCRWCHHF